jgi:hypothetical protein
MISLISKKIESLELIKKSFENTLQVEKINKKVNDSLHKLEKHLVLFTKEFPIKKNQNLLEFFLIEIKCDLYSANQLRKQHEI